MLQELHSARYLTLNLNIVECISSFPELLSRHPSPFTNLICLTIDSSMRKDAYKVKMSTEARNFLLENSPSATFIMDLPEDPATKAMKQAAEIESHMKELQASIEKGNMIAERKEKTNAIYKKIEVEIGVLSQKKMMQNDPPIGQSKEEIEMQLQGFKADIVRLARQCKICVEEMKVVINEEHRECIAMSLKRMQIVLLLGKLPKQERAEVEARYSRQLKEVEALHARLLSQIVNPYDIFAITKLRSLYISTMPSSSSTTGNAKNSANMKS
ncbi:hypothetical protein L2E82_41998 [Cichorium intybus]|uniref:Uncharacterized protein n=1 Tax=Cichorium intybus TaxID=13427 RepID=A0ACB8ZKV8_CICIN|nr:hypothetical protein L2E82_41998 [Cichorium intybus]